MSDHPIEGLMRTAMENLKEMVDVNTIIGDPVETPDGTVIMPVTKVGFGFAAGGSEFTKNGNNDAAMDHPFGGGSGGGVSITPIAFLIVNSQGVKMVHMDENTHLYEKLLEFTPQVVEKIQDMLKGGNNQNQQAQNNNQNPPNQQPPNQTPPI
ncbi:sporulation protein YtfJ [Alteribacillus persepolensis]|uniref:Sporulation protein YtfJ n=1 Tax=Alteribacillus persepolensis TaxID=568899 RepID=A0A1G8BFZ6_9BACI|nr:GerW family sporulation protein [Alteribacillus persepolensis]SDH32088.1 sporulation protein YtfJ [Alteribacillus persepolensis]